LTPVAIVIFFAVTGEIIAAVIVRCLQARAVVEARKLGAWSRVNQTCGAYVIGKTLAIVCVIQAEFAEATIGAVRGTPRQVKALHERRVHRRGVIHGQSGAHIIHSDRSGLVIVDVCDPDGAVPVLIRTMVVRELDREGACHAERVRDVHGARVARTRASVHVPRRFTILVVHADHLRSVDVYGEAEIAVHD
jgi:hypothetical protein